jgi:hypothetical protein
MLWNELDFEIQREVLLKIINLVDDEPNMETRDAIRAAFLELRMWSNFPCPVIDNKDIANCKINDTTNDIVEAQEE